MAKLNPYESQLTNGAAADVWSFAKIEQDNVLKSAASSSATSINTTTDNTITITVQWSSANAGNIISVEQGYTRFY